MSESVIDPCSSLCESIGPNFWTKQRLETFVNWPFQSPNSQCNPERMAAAGFVAIGGNDEPDLVECFVCKKQMDGWDPDDDPWDEHVKHTTSCPYIKLNKQDEKQWTVREFFNLINEYTLSCKVGTIRIMQFLNESKHFSIWSFSRMGASSYKLMIDK